MAIKYVFVGMVKSRFEIQCVVMYLMVHETVYRILYISKGKVRIPKWLRNA